MIKYLGLEEKKINKITKILNKEKIESLVISEAIEALYNILSKDEDFVGLEMHDLIIQKVI
jgi:hypothetical protein